MRKHHGGTSLGTTYYWIVARYGGRLVILGPKIDEQEAQTFGYQKLDVPFDVIKLPTRDRARATSMIKAKFLESTGDLGGALQWARHQAPGAAEV